MMPVAAAALAAFVLLVLPAGAHAPFKSFSPARGSTVPRALAAASVNYKNVIRSGSIVVTGPKGIASRSTTRVVSGGKTLQVRLKGGLPAGRYTASFRTLHTDGDTTRGTWSFRLTK